MGLIQEIDFGTPIKVSDTIVTLEIDGVSVSVPAGTSVMAAAKTLGTTIPKLCATDMLENFGSCRLCLVEVEGRNGTPASCTTPATCAPWASSTLAVARPIPEPAPVTSTWRPCSSGGRLLAGMAQSPR